MEVEVRRSVAGSRIRQKTDIPGLWYASPERSDEAPDANAAKKRARETLEDIRGRSERAMSALRQRIQDVEAELKTTKAELKTTKAELKTTKEELETTKVLLAEHDARLAAIEASIAKK